MNLATGEETDVPVGMMDVYQEFNSLSEKYKIMKFKSKAGICFTVLFFSFLCVCIYPLLFFCCCFPALTESGEELRL